MGLYPKYSPMVKDSQDMHLSEVWEVGEGRKVRMSVGK